MSSVNGQGFGDLTLNIGNKQYDIKKFDVNNNGTLEETELNALLQKIQEDGGDMFNAQTILDKFDANGDNEINFDEAKLWKITEEVGQAVKAFDSTIAQDFVGGLVGYQNDVKSDVREFAEQYINNNVNANTADFTTAFQAALETQYTTVIKPKYEQLHERQLREDSISQITDDVVNYILENNPDMSDTQIGRLGDWVFARVTELVNSPNNYSVAEITQMIKDELDETPADMVNDEIFTDWEAYSQEIEDAGVYIDPAELANLKAKAKALLSFAMSKGIKLQQNGHNLSISQMENAIEQNYGGSTGGHALITWINQIKSAIECVSGLSKAELIAYGAQELVLDIDTCVIGDIPKIDEEAKLGVIQEVIEAVMKGKSDVAGLPSEIRARLAQLLRNEAERFAESYMGNSLPAFKTALTTRLEAYFDKPIAQDVLDKVSEMATEVGAINTIDPSDDIEKLRDILSRLGQAISETGFEVVDKNGHQLDLSGVRVDVANVDEVIALIQTIINHIQSYAANNSTINLIQVVNNNKIYVDLDTGNVGVYFDPAIVEEIIDNAITGAMNGVVGGHQTEVADRLKEYAKSILQNYPNDDIDGLEDWLKEKLICAINDPAAELASYIDACNLGDKENYTILCEDSDFDKLERAFKGLLELANTLGIKFQDSNGGELTADIILREYNKQNAGDLYDLIMNIGNKLRNYETSMQEMFETYENGIFKFTITGTQIGTMTTNEAVTEAINAVAGNDLTLSRRLTAYAQLILPNCPNEKPDDIKTWLVTELNKLKANPGQTLVDTFEGLYPLGTRAEYGVNCTDAKLKELKNAFKGLLQLANALGITLKDADGNVMTEAFVDKFNKSNADTLWTIIDQYKKYIASPNAFTTDNLTSSNGLTIEFYNIIKCDTTENNFSGQYSESYERHDGKDGARRDVDSQVCGILLGWAQRLCAMWGITYNSSIANSLYETARNAGVDDNGWYDSGDFCCNDLHACDDTIKYFTKSFSQWVGEQI